MVFKVLFVNSKGTIRSKEHGEVMRKYGLDKRAANAI